MFLLSAPLVAGNAFLQALIHHACLHKKHRHWVLPAFNALLMSTYAMLALPRWLFVHDLTPSEGDDFAFQQLQAYLIVDLVYSGILCHDPTQKFLELWVHHIAYIALVCAIMTLGKSGITAPYLLVEIPAAIRALGTLNPAWRTDNGFGATFFLLRVVAPFLIIVRDYPVYEGYYFAIFGTMQLLHIYWFALWCKSYCGGLRKGVKHDNAQQYID